MDSIIESIKRLKSAFGELLRALLEASVLKREPTPLVTRDDLYAIHERIKDLENDNVRLEFDIEELKNKMASLQTVNNIGNKVD